MSERRFDLIGLGYCGLDYFCLTPGIPIDDKMEALATLTQGGGPAATATYTAAKLGANSAFLSAIGDDERSIFIREELESVGVNTSGLISRAGTESPAAFCWTDSANGQRSIVWTRGKAAPLAVDEIDLEPIKSARLLHLDGHQTTAAIQAAEIARANGVTVAMDAGTLVPGIEKLLELSDIIIASEKFMERFTGLGNPDAAACKLFHAGCKFAAVTMGSQGSFGFDGTRTYHQPSFKVNVIDTTGAGDVFHGAFAYRFLTGGDWAECLRFSAAVAALKCTQFGGRTGIPTLTETERFLSEQN